MVAILDRDREGAQGVGAAGVIEPRWYSLRRILRPRERWKLGMRSRSTEEQVGIGGLHVTVLRDTTPFAGVIAVRKHPTLYAHAGAPPSLAPNYTLVGLRQSLVRIWSLTRGSHNDAKRDFLVVKRSQPSAPSQWRSWPVH